MDVVKQIIKSIEYMENNLMEKISFKEAAESVYMSSFIYHRTFKIFTGLTPNEYIRNRRLSMAGEELCLEESSILEVALKYQYDSLEGFSKAFHRFHGVNPSKLKKGEAKLRVFNPLKIKFTFEGGESMMYKLVTLEPFTLLLKKKEFYIDAEENLIPKFWEDEQKKGLLQTLFKEAVAQDLYGVCHQVDSSSNRFDYGIGVKVEEEKNIDGLENLTITQPLWAVFECNSVDHIGEVWDYIVKDFLVNTQFERVETLDFEFYPNDRQDIFCELYIPVRRKDS